MSEEKIAWMVKDDPEIIRIAKRHRKDLGYDDEPQIMIKEDTK
jgi:type IV secretory pathway TrbD component